MNNKAGGLLAILGSYALADCNNISEEVKKLENTFLLLILYMHHYISHTFASLANI